MEFSTSAGYPFIWREACYELSQVLFADWREQGRNTFSELGTSMCSQMISTRVLIAMVCWFLSLKMITFPKKEYLDSEYIYYMCLRH